MRYVFVLVLSLVSGGAVYFLTLRTGGQEQLAGLGFAPEAPAQPRPVQTHPLPAAGVDPDAVLQREDVGAATEPTAVDGPAPAPSPHPGAGYTYLRVAISGPSWRERVQGFVGLVVLIAVSAAVLALAVYEVGHVINQTIAHFLN